MNELMQQILQWVQAHPVWAGAVVCLIAFAESVAIIGILVPGVVILFGVGALIAVGALDFWTMCAWAVAGAVAGDGLSFWLGRHYHQQLQHLWPFSRHPQMLHKGIAFFHRNGGVSVVIGRFFGPVRATIPFVAGMLEMKPSHFLAANVGSALLWAPAYLLPGMALGASLEAASAVALRLVILLLGLLGSVWLLERSLRWIGRRLGRGIAWGLLLVLLGLPIMLGGGQTLNRLWHALEGPPETGELAMDTHQWWRSGWQDLPARRQGLAGNAETLNLQYGGELARLQSLLKARGWQTASRPGVAEVTRWLSPEAPLSELPVLPRLHGNRFEHLILVRNQGTQREVLRIWPAGRLSDGVPLWLGSVHWQARQYRLWTLFSYAVARNGEEAVRRLWEELVDAPLWLRRVDGRLLLRQPAGSTISRE